MRPQRSVGLIVTCLVLLGACGSDEDVTTVAFTSPSNGAKLSGAVQLAMTATGITIEEAGEARTDAGHFHVIADAGCTTTGETIAKDADHVHLGGGQSEGVIYLEPGTHELCLQVGDGIHSALDITATRTVEIGITDQAGWCDVIGQVDELFDTIDNGDGDFAAKQAGYENIRRLVAQLEDGLDHTDPAARADLAATLAFARALTTAVVEADDADAAEKAVQPLFDRTNESLPGAEWMRDTCGIDIDS